MNAQQIRYWLRENDPARLEELWARADRTRREGVGDEVHLRALVEISSYCPRRCGYCGLRADRADLPRYRMELDEIVECAELGFNLGCGTVVLQAGEDPAITKEWGCDLIGSVRSRLPGMAITLSLGERTEDELRAWRAAGADRYLLRFETSNRGLYDRIHPPRAAQRSDRIAILGQLRRLGYQVGSGALIGIPGQSYEDLARDIELFGELDLDMIGAGPFIPHPDTPLGQEPQEAGTASAAEGGCARQVPNTELMTYKVMALARLVCPDANIPATTALATLNRVDGRELGLMRGANVVMPNMTPAKYRASYDVYPNKACVGELPQTCLACLAKRLDGIGRRIGTGRGDSRRGSAPPVAADKT